MVSGWDKYGPLEHDLIYPFQIQSTLKKKQILKNLHIHFKENKYFPTWLRDFKIQYI